MGQVLHYGFAPRRGALRVAVGETHGWGAIKRRPALKGPNRLGQPLAGLGSPSGDHRPWARAHGYSRSIPRLRDENMLEVRGKASLVSRVRTSSRERPSRSPFRGRIPRTLDQGASPATDSNPDSAGRARQRSSRRIQRSSTGRTRGALCEIGSGRNPNHSLDPGSRD